MQKAHIELFEHTIITLLNQYPHSDDVSSIPYGKSLLIRHCSSCASLPDARGSDKPSWDTLTNQAATLRTKGTLLPELPLC